MKPRLPPARVGNMRFLGHSCSLCSSLVYPEGIGSGSPRHHLWCRNLRYRHGRRRRSQTRTALRSSPRMDTTSCLSQAKVGKNHCSGCVRSIRSKHIRCPERMGRTSRSGRRTANRSRLWPTIRIRTESTEDAKGRYQRPCPNTHPDATAATPCGRATKSGIRRRRGTSRRGTGRRIDVA